MGLKSILAGLAARAPVPVFPLVGPGARNAVQELRLEDSIDLVASPRRANVLLLAGGVGDHLLWPALRVHDELSHPRSTVWWSLGAPTDRLAAACPNLIVVEGGRDDLVAALLRSHRELLLGQRASDPPIQPDVPPVPWRGVGPYGQGGKGMTGGTPYGRPLPGTAADRDGLQLDQLLLRIGPFFSPFPPGLVLELKIQGDVVQEASVDASIFDGKLAGCLPRAEIEIFRSAITQPVLIADLEVARARHHLRWFSEALWIHGLHGFGRRVLRLALDLQPQDQGELRSLAQTLDRLRSLEFATAGAGILPAAALGAHVTGPVARASGRATDARVTDPAYIALGFEPVTHTEGDARARWRQRLAEAVQALALAGRAGNRRTVPNGVVESPWGQLSRIDSPMTPLLELLPQLLAGQEWGEAVTTLVSLDLDLEVIPTGSAAEAAA